MAVIDWKPICSHYEVSDNGIVKRTRWDLLKPHKINSGYYCVSIHGRTYCIHRLVLEAFIGPSDLDVNHKDGNKLNNNLSNLEYVTRSDNAKHAFRLGLQKPMQGINSPQAKLTNEKVYRIRALYDSRTPRKNIAEEFDVCVQLINRIGRRVRWSHLPEQHA